MINCAGDNESFFRKLNSALANQSCKILKDHTVTPENFELVKENMAVPFSRRSIAINLGKPNAGYPKVFIRT